MNISLHNSPHCALRCLAVFMSVALLLLGTTAKADDPPESKVVYINPVEVTIEKLLEQKVDVWFADEKLSALVELGRQYSVPIALDRRAFDDAGIGEDLSFSFTAEGVRLRSALAHILRDFDLTWMVRDDLLMITTVEEAESYLVTRIYDVRDLVEYWRDETGVTADTDSLIEIVTTTIAPTTWDEVGGPGSVGDYQAGTKVALVVSQTLAVHAEIVRLFASLRKLGGEPSSASAPKQDSRRTSRTVRAAPKRYIDPAWNPSK